MATLAPATAVPLRQLVYDAIVAALLQGRLEPGVRLSEAHIARQMGISKAPVREAFRQLEEQRLLVSFPNRGTFVRAFQEDDVHEVYSLRIALEGLAIRLAASRLTADDVRALAELSREQDDASREGRRSDLTAEDLEFHRLIWRVASHTRLFDILQSIQLQTALAMTTFNRLAKDFSGAAHSHQAIIEALQRGNGIAAEEAMRCHLQASCDELIRLLRETPPPGATLASATDQTQDDDLAPSADAAVATHPKRERREGR